MRHFHYLELLATKFGKHTTFVSRKNLWTMSELFLMFYEVLGEDLITAAFSFFLSHLLEVIEKLKLERLSN